MRRNCPHCGADQLVADEKLTAGWVFLKCHHCAALSPVQGRASQNLAKAAEKNLRAPKPMVSSTPLAVPVAPKMEEPRVEPLKAVPSFPPVPEFLKTDPTKIIETSGPSEGDEPSLFESDESTGDPVPILLEEEAAPRERFSFFKPFAQTAKPYALPLALAIVCFGSGGYLVRSARMIRQGSWLLSAQNDAPVASDVVPATAPAPVLPALAEKTMATAQREPAAPAQAPRIVERKPASSSAETEKKVEVLAASAVLRAGPGVQYNKVGTARAELQLWVKGSFDNWIEVRTGEGAKTAWIRSDLVKPLKQVAQQEAQP